MVSIFIILFSSVTLDSILEQPLLDHAHVGMIVIDLERDSVVYANNYRKLLVPASNAKIVTSAAALMFLGQDFRFRTYLGTDGQIRSGRLRGDIFIEGRGDPNFSLENIEQFITALKDRGVREIDGNIILDDSYFTEERLPVGWAWHYLDARYAAEVSALSLNRNVVNVHIESTRPGQLAHVTIEPATRYVKLVNDMITKMGDDSIIIFRRPEANIIYVDGGIGFRKKRDIEVSVKDPTFYFGEYFKERLVASDIRVKGSCVEDDGSSHSMPARYNTIDSVLSPPMLEILKELNSESVNLFGEAILKTLGSHFLQDGSFHSGVSILKEFLRRCGVDTSLVAWYDGSGLSRHNLVSPYDIALVLRRMYHSEMFDTYYNLLPAPGEGTMVGRYGGLKGFLRAKTGTLHAVSCLSGYLHVGKKYYCFSMMFNNFSCPRRQIETIQEDLLNAVLVFLKKET